MRRRGRLDANHAAIVRALASVGASVQSLADIGRGCPDLLVGWEGETFLLEVKDGSKPASARALTSDEYHWIARWSGRRVAVVTSMAEALAAIGIGAREPKDEGLDSAPRSTDDP